MSGSGKLYRFPPTRELGASYDSVVPPSRRRGVRVRELHDYLRRREEDIFVEDGETEREHPIILPPVETLADIEYDEEGSQESWTERQERRLIKKIAALRRALYLARKEEKEAEKGLKILMQSARESASGTAVALSHHMSGVPQLEEVIISDTVHCASSSCNKRALPYSKYCLLHMSSDQDQVLYGVCAASEPGSGVCGSTVPDILLNTPLCTKHITKSALETSVQQQKKKSTATSGTTGRPNKTTKTKGQKTKKKTAVTKLVVTKSSAAIATTPAAVGVAVLSCSSSWSSGDSDGENPTINDAKRPKFSKSQKPTEPVAAKSTDQLPSLAPEATLDLSLTAPMPSLILPPPLPDIGKFMDDSSSEDG